MDKQSEANPLSASDVVLKLSIELGPKFVSTKATVTEIRAAIDEAIDHAPQTAYAKLLSLVALHIDNNPAYANGSDAPSHPVHVQGSYGPCGSCYVEGGGNGQQYYDGVGGVFCFSCCGTYLPSSGPTWPSVCSNHSATIRRWHRCPIRRAAA